MRLSYEEMLERLLQKRKAVPSGERFKLPEALLRLQGARTLLTNFAEIAKTFRRDRQHLAKFLLKQLATSGSIEESMLVMQGRLPKELVQKKLEDYARIFVICKQCKNPDTKLIKEGRIYLVECEACGARYSAR